MKILCLYVRRDELTNGCALRTLLITSIATVNSRFPHAKLLRTHFVRPLHVPNEVKNAFVIPTIRPECVTQRDCFQMFPISLQPNISSYRDGDFCGG